MPINDGSTTYTEKITSKIAITPTSSSLKNNTQHDMPLLHNTNTTSTSSSSSSNNSPKHFDNMLLKQQCHKWQEIFDFNKVLKQLQNEKRGKHDGHNTASSATTTTNVNVAGGGSNNSTNPSNASNNSNNGRETVNNGEVCVAKQVQRLNGSDMHFYGVAPKQEALDVVVCNICMGIYTMMGFNNHMQLHHPTVWSTVSTKLANNNEAVSASLASTFGTHANDNSQDSVRDPIPVNELVLGSPSDLSGTMSTCSNASSSSSSLSSTAPYGVVGYTSSHHKSRKNGSTASSSGGSSSSGGRSRSKSKHHSSSSSSPSVHTSSASSTTSATDLPTASKNSKKNLSVNLSNVANISTGSTIASNGSKDMNMHLSSVGNGKSTEQIVSVYSTSSSSSSSSSSSTSSGSGSGSAVTGLSSLPPTPKILKTTNTTAEIATALSTPSENSFVSSGGLLPISETKEKHSVEASTLAANKKKGTSPAFIGHDGSIDSSASSTNSLENERGSNFKSSNANGTGMRANRTNNKTGSKVINAKSGTHTNTGSSSNCNNATAMKPSSGKDLSQYNAQISELDQAVSSITEGHDTNSCSNNKSELNLIESTLPANGVVDGNSVIGNALPHGIPTAESMTAVANYANFLPTAAVGCDESMSQQTPDDNSILTLEDMLDSKFINEILNTAETEIHFDENELDNDTTSQQAYGQTQQQQQQQQQQQPAVKRMRYDDELANGYAVFQQQQHQQQQQQSYEGYDEQQAAVAHYQAQTDGTQQITTIDAMQLQQLLYQQQQQQHYTGTANAAQAYDPQTGALVDAKQLIDLCGDDELQKHQQQKQILEAEAKLADYATLTTLGGVGVGMGVYGGGAEAQQFDVYNVPSLTDDVCGVEDVDMLLPTLVTRGNEHHHHQQQQQQQQTQQQPSYVLPSNEEQLIYEITANNQVAVMSQQRQQQVIAEFLTQAGYDNVDQHMQTTTTATNTTGDVAWPMDDDDDMLDYDFSRLDTVKSVTARSSSSDFAKLPKLEHTKYQEDYYVHVCIYAGVPKPLAINCFGLIKLPQAAATTFRKQLLSTRKANNSPTTLSSCINGVVGGSGGGVLTGSLTRYASLNAKTAPTAASAPNYFTTLSGGSNEFSIGSITISNTPTSSIAGGNTQQQQQQQTFGSQQKQTPIELTLNVSANTNGPTSNVQQRAVARSKGGAATLNAAYGGTAKAKATLLGGGATLRLNATRPPALALSNGKTIVVASNANATAATSPLLTGSGGGDRGVKCLRRSLICKLDLNAQRRSNQQQQLSKQIAEVLQAGKNVLRQQQQNTNMDNAAISEQQQQQQQLKLQRVRNFYERRRKLYNLNQHTSRPSFAQPPIKQQKLLKQQLLRTLSDCGLNSMKSGNTAGGDVMRVYV